MRPPAKPVPDGFSTVTAHLCIKGAADAIEFYTKAFAADELVRIPGPGGIIMHAALAIGDSVILLNDEFPDMGVFGPKALGGTPVSLHLYLEGVDDAFQRAVDAGAEPLMPPTDMFWGDRYSMVLDPFGHKWALATHIEDLTPEEIERRQAEHFAQSAP